MKDFCCVIFFVVHLLAENMFSNKTKIQQFHLFFFLKEVDVVITVVDFIVCILKLARVLFDFC